jgi:serine/threonine protein phosphatase PrpC
MLIMHSDGISSRFSLAEYYGLIEQPAQFIADVLLRDWGRVNDDATVLVVRREMKNEHRETRPS